jgi:hypothetical protein
LDSRPHSAFENVQKIIEIFCVTRIQTIQAPNKFFVVNSFTQPLTRSPPLLDPDLESMNLAISKRGLSEPAYYTEWVGFAKGYQQKQSKADSTLFFYKDLEILA